MLRGLLRAGECEPQDIIASQPDEALRDDLANETGVQVTAGNIEAAENAAMVLIGVKPGVVLPVVREIAPAIKEKLVVSLAAGIRLDAMESAAEARFLRVMTNTPAVICRGAAAFARGTRTTNEDVEWIRSAFGSIGVIEEVAEEQIDAVTALAGSGPAFVYTVIEALAEGATAEGMSREVALKLATQTALGAASLVAESGLSPEELRAMVITPGGTTAAGLAVMKEQKTREGLAAAVRAATVRGREMAAQ